MTTLQPKFKSYVSSFTLRLGPLVSTGSLVGVRKPKSKYDAGNYSLVTEDGKPVKQVYLSEDGTILDKGQLKKAKQVKVGTEPDGSVLIDYKIVDSDSVDEIKKDVLPKNVLVLQVHDKTEVDNALFQSDSNGYVFVPDVNDPVNVQMYDVMREALAKDKAFIGMGNIRGFDTLTKAYMWRGNIVLQKALFPEDVNEHLVREEPVLSADTKEKVSKMLNRFSKPFVAEDYRNVKKEKLAELEGSSAVDVIVSPSGAVTFDLDALLDEYL